MLPIFLVISDEDLVLDSEKEGEKYIPFVWGGREGMGLTFADSYKFPSECLGLLCSLPALTVIEFSELE